MNYKYCYHCGKQIPANALFCRYCGVNQNRHNLRSTSKTGSNFKKSLLQIFKAFHKNWNNYNGCTTRRDFNLSILWVAIIVILLIIFMAIGNELDPNDSIITVLMIVVFFVADIYYFIAVFCLTIRRAHDVGLETVWAVLLTWWGSYIFIIVMMCMKTNYLDNQKFKQRAINKGHFPVV